MLRESILPLMLSFALSIAAAIAQEVPVSSIELGPADGNQNIAAVASSGDVALVLWNEYSSPVFPSRADAFAARVNAAGEVLDRLPIRITAARSGSVRAAAWTGSRFLVAWNDTYNAYLTTVATDGNILGTFEYAGASAQTLSCHATACLVTFVAGQPWARTLDTLVTDSDGVARVPRQTIAQLGTSTFTVLSAASEERFLVAWSRFDASQTPRASHFYAAVAGDGRASASQSLPAVSAFGGLAGDSLGYLLAVWEGTGLAFQRITSDGRPDGTAVRPNIGPVLNTSTIGLASSDEGFVAVGTETFAQRRLLTTALTRDGRSASAPATLSAGAIQAIGIARLGSNMIVATSEGAGESDAVARIITPSGSVVVPKISVANSSRAQSAPVTLFAGRRLLTVWSEWVEGRAQLRMSILRDGIMRELEQWVSPSGEGQSAPGLAFNGSEYLVTWSEGSRIVGRRFATSGASLDPEPVHLADGSGGAVASHDRDFFLVWSEQYQPEGTNTFRTRVAFARISGNATFDKVIVSPAGTLAQAADVTWDGSSFVVLWTNVTSFALCSPIDCTFSEVRASRIDTAGNLLDREGIVLAPEGSHRNVRIVASPAGSVAVWNEAHQVFGALLRRDGTATAPRLLASETGPIAGVDLTNLGSQLFLGWTVPGKVRGAFVSPDASTSGRPIDLAISAVTDFFAPALFDFGGGQVGLVYQRSVDDAEHGRSRRLFARTQTVSAERRRAAGR